MNLILGWLDDLEALLAAGTRLDLRLLALRGLTFRDVVAATLLRIRDREGRLVELRANRAQREFARSAGQRSIVLKARQLGITTYMAARFFVSTITRPGTLTVQVAHDQRAAEQIFRIVHRFLANLPEWLRAGALVTSRANVRQLVFPRLDSEYRVETAADPNAGRGLTIHHLHCSEVARWPGDAAATLAALRAAVPPQGEVVLESTANGAGGCFYDEWQRAQETGYTRHFFPWWWEPSYARPGAEVAPLTAEEEDLVRGHGLTRAQIAYRRELRSSFRGLAPQEFAEDAQGCFLASGECAFELEVIQRRLAQCGPPLETRDNGCLEIYWPPPLEKREGAASVVPLGLRNGNGASAPRAKQYVIGVDCAGGGAEGDFACAQVIERTTGLQCAELRGHFSPRELAARVANLGREYNHALLAVERNNHGHGVLALLESVHRYENLYQRDRKPGWLTSSVTRPEMLENFGAVLSEAPHLFSSRRLLEECRTFVRHAAGFLAAASGAHDDCVLAMAIALAVRREVVGDSRSGRLEMGTLPNW
ncbi:MAG: terminase [Terriglobales bacterium]